MSKIIEARAVISAEDRTGAVFDRIGRKFKDLGKNASVSAEVEKLGKSLERLGQQKAAVDRLQKSMDSLAAARTRFREAQAAVEASGRAMAAAAKPTKAMEDSHKKAQAAVTAASKAYEKQVAVAKEAKASLSGFGVPVGQLLREQKQIGGVIDKTTAALERQVQVAERRANRREALGTVAAAAGVMAGHAVKHGAHASWETYREFDKERRFSRAVMGISDDEQKPLVDQALHVGATTRYNDVQVLEAQRELAARGLKKDQVMGLMSPAASLGQSLDLSLPDAVKQMEGAIFGFKKDISTLPAAMASAKQTADVQVKAAKISGMTPEDIRHAYRYGTQPARMAGLSEQGLLAFAGISKKANIGGDEAGTAFRALVSNILSPTRKAKEAMLANGLDYKNYQKNPNSIDENAFTKTVAAQYGVELDKTVRDGLKSIFTNKGMIADPSKFTPAVMKLLSDNLGGDDAKSKKSIAGLANRFRDASMKGVDANRFLEDLMTAIPKNPALANAIFGSKQGGRIANALGDPETFKHMLEELLHHADGYSDKISNERMAGFDGAVTRFQGAIKNLESRTGQAWDNGGKGGLLTNTVSAAASAANHLAELDNKTIQVGSALLALGATTASAAGTMKLFGNLAGMPALAAGGGIAAAFGGITIAAVGLTGALYALSDEAKGLTHGGTPDRTLNPGDELPGLPGSTDKPSWTEDHGKVRRMTEVSLPPGGSQPASRAAEGVPSLIDAPFKDAKASIDQAREALAGYRKELETLKSEVAATADLGLPGVGGGSDGLKASLEKKIGDQQARLKTLRAPVPDARLDASTRAPQGPITAEVKSPVPVNVTGTLSSPEGKLAGQITILPSPLLTAKIDKMEGTISAMKGTISALGSRPGAPSMPGAASTPGAGGQ